MRKPILLMMLIALLIPIGVTHAQPSDEPPFDPAALADLIPADTDFFVSVRTDDAYLDQLDGILQRFGPLLDLPEGVTTRELFGEIFNSSPQSVREWFGDGVALAVGDFAEMQRSMESPMYLVIDINDRAAAEAVVSPLFFNDREVEPIDALDFTVFRDNSDTIVLVSDDVMIITNSEEAMDRLITGDFARLASSEDFNNARALLPGEAYNILVYIDTGAVVAANAQDVMDRRGTDPLTELNLAVADALDPQMFGLTILDDRSLVLDAASSTSDPDTFRALGLLPASPLVQEPVDLGFAASLPVGTQFAILGTGLGPTFEASIDSLTALGNLLREQARTSLETGAFDEAAIQLATLPNIGGLTNGGLTVMFAGLTGLNLGEDVLPWMTGDYALYLNILPVDGLPLTIDMGLITETSDNAAAIETVAAIQSAAERYDATPTTETFGSIDTVIGLGILRDLLRGTNFADRIDDVEELDLLVGTRDDGGLFAVGTRPGVAFAMDPAGPSLAANPAFSYAADNVFLEDAQSVYWVDLTAFAASLGATGVLPPSAAVDVAALATAIESASITMRTEDGLQGTVRAVLTLSEPLTAGE